MVAQEFNCASSILETFTLSLYAVVDRGAASWMGTTDTHSLRSGKPSQYFSCGIGRTGGNSGFSR